jgi:predicted aconitase with swiveling domain
MKLKGHIINEGVAEGEAIVTTIPFSFLGELDPETGKVPSPSHELFGQSLAGKVFIFPTGKGSSMAPAIAWYAMLAGNAPCAMVCERAEPVVASAAITINIPMLDRLEKNPVEVIKTGDYVRVDAIEGIVEITRK